MRTTHAVFVPIAVFAIALAGGYLLNYQYDGAPLAQYILDYIKPITCACVSFLVMITVDFLRRATHPTNYHDINQSFFMWCITIAILYELILGVCEGVLLSNETSKIHDLLSGRETLSIVFIVGTVIANVFSYAINVDINVWVREVKPA
jgi:hypothetical protein